MRKFREKIVGIDESGNAFDSTDDDLMVSSVEAATESNHPSSEWVVIHTEKISVKGKTSKKVKTSTKEYYLVWQQGRLVRYDEYSSDVLAMRLYHYLYRSDEQMVSDEEEDALAKDVDWRLRDLAAQVTKQPQILTELAKDPHPEVRKSVAENKATPKNLLQSFASDPDHNVRWAFVDSARAETDKLDLLATDENEDVRIAVAQNKSTSPQALDLLALQYPTFVARNPNTPPETLQRIFDSLAEDDELREVIANNKNAPAKVLDSVIDQWPLVVAANLNASEAQIEKLINHTDDEVRHLAFKHPRVNPRQLIEAAQSKDENMRKAAASNSNLPAEWVEKLARDPDAGVRGATLEHQNLSEETLREMQNDTSSLISFLAKLKVEELDEHKNQKKTK